MRDEVVIARHVCAVHESGDGGTCVVMSLSQQSRNVVNRPVCSVCSVVPDGALPSPIVIWWEGEVGGLVGE